MLEELNKNKKAKSLNTPFILFLGLIFAALIISAIPIINWPFTWMQTFFHEVSHGIAALLTGGSVHSIEIRLRGSGLCTTSGGIRFIIAFSGYFGAVVWGVMLYKMADSVSMKSAITLASIMVGAIIFTALLWGRDIITLIIMGIMLVPFIFIIKLEKARLIKYFLQFIGIYVLIDAIKSPLYLIDGRSKGDGSTLSDLTYVPEIVWVSIWFAIGWFALYYLWKSHKEN